jgi:hypothetical protein
MFLTVITVACKSLVELTVAVDVLVVLFKGCADELLKVGTGVAVSVEAKAEIVACAASIITVSTPTFDSS